MIVFQRWFSKCTCYIATESNNTYSSNKIFKNLIEAIDNLRISPHLIIVGTTGVYSKFTSCSSEYKYSEKLF